MTRCSRESRESQESRESRDGGGRADAQETGRFPFFGPRGAVDHGRFMLSFPAIRAALALSTCVVLFGCGGAAEDGLLDGPAAATPDASSAPPSSPGDSGAPPSKGPPGGGARDAAPSPSFDANPPVVPDATPAQGVDSSPPPATDPGITCGTKKPCDPTSKVCCVFDDGNGNHTYDCENASTCSQNGGLGMPCANATDCLAAGSPAGTVCCVTEGQGSQAAASVACVPAAQCGGSSQSWLCDPSDPSSCPAGETCTTSTVTIPPYSICVKAP
jgi:hypothetical protein